jgi:hypothetical protein
VLSVIGKLSVFWYSNGWLARSLLPLLSRPSNIRHWSSYLCPLGLNPLPVHGLDVLEANNLFVLVVDRWSGGGFGPRGGRDGEREGGGWLLGES